MRRTDTRNIEFDAVVGAGGLVEIPRGALRELGAETGSRLRVRLTARRLAIALKRRRVQESEIDAIASRQMESREHVLTFLLAEGTLSHSGLPRKHRR